MVISSAEGAPELNNMPTTPSSSTGTNSAQREEPFPVSRIPEALRNIPGVVFHAMQVDASEGPASMATQITQSIMGALSNVFGGSGGEAPVSANVAPTTGPSAGESSTRSTSRTATSSELPTGSNSIPGLRGRVFSRPTIRASEGTVSTHQLVRAETPRALASLIDDLARITTDNEGLDLFPTANVATSSLENSQTLSEELQLLKRSLAAFERTYWMLASANREIREGLAAGALPWDRLHNLLAMLQDMPLLMVVQRRLLSTLRSRPGSSHPELPSSLDVPSFLDRPRPPGNAHNCEASTAHMDMIEPPE